MNQSDSEIIKGSLEEYGYEIVQDPGEADVLLLNTCSVREHAEVRAIGRLTDIYRHKGYGRGKVLGILGCVAQHHGGKISERAPGVDLIMGPDNYRELPRILEEIVEGRLETFEIARLDRKEMYDGMKPKRASRTSAWIQVMRGCDRFCSYCIVPYVRGRERSRETEEIIDEVTTAAGDGIPEVILLGQNVNSYSYGDVDFAALLRKVSEVSGIHRVRFMTSHPIDFSEEIISVMKECPVICNALHLPLQSGSARVLKAMERGYTVEEYCGKIERLRDAIPDVTLTTDLMVGFPGETEDDFRLTMETVERIRFDSAFMFKYSSRKGTKAANYPGRVAPQVAAARLSELIDLQKGITTARNSAMVGKTLTVILEGRARKGDGMLLARTEGDKMVILRGNDGERPGSLLDVTIVDTTGATLIGELLDSNGNMEAPSC